MDIANISIGTDIEEICRFRNRTLENDEHFFKHIYTTKELEYCFSKGVSSQHLCARFCGKEAIIKALSDLGITNIHLKDIEILNMENGAPYANIKKYPNIKIKISLSHTKEYAMATVIVQK